MKKVINEKIIDWFNDHYYWDEEEGGCNNFAFEHIIDLYGFIEYFEREESNVLFTFSQKRQLFLELVEYYMEKGLLRFEGEYYTPETPLSEIGKTPKYWSKETGIEDTMKYLSDAFPSFDYKYPQYPYDEEKCKDKKYFKKHCEEEGKFISFFYVYCPPAYWWDEYEQKWIADE